jgi:DNA-binding response OmpR family regulator
MTVLLIDDEEAVRRAVARILARAGYEVVQAADGAEALAIAAARTFDLAICDLSLPDMTGVELAAQLVAVRPGVRVLFASGHHGLDLPPESSFVQKPVPPRVLLAAVSSFAAPAAAP